MKKIFKISVSLIIVVIVAIQIDWHEFAESLDKLKWWAIPAAVALQFGAFVVGAKRWQSFFRYHKIPYTLAWLLRPYFIGTLFNNVLPMATGGDIVRVYYIYRETKNSAIAMSPVITERIVGLLVLLGIASAVTPFVDIPGIPLDALSRILSILFFTMLCCLLCIGIPHTYHQLQNILKRGEHRRIVRALLRIADAIHLYVRHFLLMLQIICLSILAQCLVIIIFWLLGTGIGVQTDIIQYFLVVPLVLAASSLPISIGGLGVREATAIALFTAMGMSQGDAAVIAILFIPVLLLASLPGLYYFLTVTDHNQLVAEAEKATV